MTLHIGVTLYVLLCLKDISFSLARKKLYAELSIVDLRAKLMSFIFDKTHSSQLQEREDYNHRKIGRSAGVYAPLRGYPYYGNLSENSR